MAEPIALRGITWSDPRGYDPLVAATRIFQQRHPQVSIGWDKRSLQEFESTPVAQLAQRYDLMIIDHPHVGEVVADGCLLPFDLHADALALARLESQTVGKSFHSYLYGGHQWALPVDAACQVQAYRADLRDGPAPGIDAVLKEAVAGRVLWPLRPPHVLMSYFTLMANIGAPFPISRDEDLDLSASRHVLDVMQKLADRVDPACLNMDPIAALDALSGETEFALVPLTYLYAPYAREGYRPARITYADIPALGKSGPLGSALGGTGLAVSAATSEPELCIEFAIMAASADAQCGYYTQNNGQPGNALAWANSAVNAPVGDAYFRTRMSHEAAWLRPRHKGYMGFQESASQILLGALTGATSHDRATSALQKRLSESFDA